MADDATLNPVQRLANIWREAANTRLYNEVERLECLALIDDWQNLRTAVSALTSSADVTSYSIAGRTVTRATMASVRHEADALADEILAILRMGGGAPVADMRAAMFP